MSKKASSEPQAIGRYDLLNKIAEGGMGTVYRGRHRDSGQMVAVKLVPQHLVANPVFLKRFEQEYNAARTLDHPNVVRALEFGYEAGTPYLVMEFVEGESVGQKLERTGRLEESEAIRIIGQVAQGLHKAHKLGLIHRDVKPDNILLTPTGAAKLVDLGLVKEVDADLNLTRTNRGLGTPHFMAPEQFRNAKNADVRCDVYSLAATMYMMVTGTLPFSSSGPLDAYMKKLNNEIVPPRQLVADLSERVDWAIRRSMSTEPTSRAASCREFVEDLTGHSTRRLTPSDTLDGPAADMWFMVYKDEEGVVHTVRGTMKGIRRTLKEGLLGDASHIRVSRNKAGPFESLKNHPEFRDLAIEPAPVVRADAAPRPRTPEPFPSPSSEAAPAPPPAPAPRPNSDPSRRVVPAPHIDIGTSNRPAEWIKWALLAAVALSAGILGFLLMPTR